MTMLDALLPIGFTRGGSPVYPMSGGAPVGEGDEVGANGGPPAADEVDDDDDQGDPGSDDDDTKDDADKGDDDEELGEGGKKALADTRKERDRYKGKVREARDALKPWTEIEREFSLKPEDVRARLQGKVKDAEGKEVDVSELRRSIESEVRGEFTVKLVGAQVQTIAAAMLNNADDAGRYLDLKELELDDRGNVDADEVKSMLTELITDRPYLAKTAVVPKVRKPSGGRGQGNTKDDAKTAGSVAAGLELWNKTGTKSKV